MGSVCVNALEKILPFVPVNQPQAISMDASKSLEKNKCPGDAFILQDIQPYGKVCLIYSINNEERRLKNSVYFYAQHDQGWYYMAPTFSDYFRLQIQHLGILGWQMSRTDMGLPQATMDWLCFYAPIQPLLVNRQSIVLKLTSDADSKDECFSSRKSPKISMDKISKLLALVDKEDQKKTTKK